MTHANLAAQIDTYHLRRWFPQQHTLYISQTVISAHQELNTYKSPPPPKNTFIQTVQALGEFDPHQPQLLSVTVNLALHLLSPTRL